VIGADQMIFRSALCVNVHTSSGRTAAAARRTGGLGFLGAPTSAYGSSGCPGSPRRKRRRSACLSFSASEGSFPITVSVGYMALALEISPQDVKRRLDAGEKLPLIDVREPSEFAVARLENAELVPMRQVPAELQRLEALADEAPLIVYCHHGVRSLHVVNWLREQGVEGCQSMAGGIDAWSLSVDSSVPRYN